MYPFWGGKAANGEKESVCYIRWTLLLVSCEAVDFQGLLLHNLDSIFRGGRGVEGLFDVFDASLLSCNMFQTVIRIEISDGQSWTKTGVDSNPTTKITKSTSEGRSALHYP